MKDNLTFLKADPNKAYISNNLILPKSLVRVEAIKQALTFTIGEDVLYDMGDPVGRVSRTTELWDETEHHIIVPREFISPDKYKLFRFPFIDIRPTEYPAIDVEDQINLRNETQERALQILLWNRSGTLNLACGKGKTIIALKLIAALKIPTIVIVNSSALMDQWRGKISEYLKVDSVGTIQGDIYDWKHPIVLAMVQTLAARHLQFDMEFRRRFGVAIYDECFPAGTLVGQIPIQKIKVGDSIPSYDDISNRHAFKRVTHTFRHPVTSLLRIHAEGNTVICTPNHPFLTQDGWVPAKNLTSSYMVRYTTGSTEFDQRWQSEDGDNSSKLHRVWGEYSNPSGQSNEKEGFIPNKKEESILLGILQAKPTVQREIRTDGKNQSQICFRKNEKVKSHAQCGGAYKSEHHFTDNWMEAPHSRRKWKTTSVSSGASGVCFGVANGSSCENTKGVQIRQQLPQSLQTGYCKSGFEIGNRGRREIPFDFGQKSSGPEERRAFNWARVDHVEILERGSDGTFGGVCPDGYVYNLEVEDTNTYIAAGFVVHNCHHMSAPKFVLSADMFFGRRYSLTATAHRTDGLEAIYQSHLGRVIYTDLSQAITPDTYFHILNWELPVADIPLTLDKLGMTNTSKIRTYLGTLRWRNDIIYTMARKDLAEGRRLMVLSHSEEHARLMTEEFGDTAACVTGKTKREDRLNILQTRNPVFATFQLVREWLDIPELNALYVTTVFSNSNDLQQAWGRTQREVEKQNPIVRVFEDTAIKSSVRSCRKLRGYLKALKYPFKKIKEER